MDPVKLREFLETQCQMDAASGKLIARRTRRPVTAVVPVHLDGQTADMDPILELAEAYGLIVVEDACQAHGAEYFSQRENRWRKAGTMGKAAAFSFYPGKNLGACGEAGAVTTADAEVARIVRMLRDHGQSKKYYHDLEGYNGRLDAIQAGILGVKLVRLPEWNEKRRQIATLYGELLATAEDALTLPHNPSWSRPVHHLYVIRHELREELRKHLADAGIDTGIHYPIALHLQKAYAGLGYSAGDFPLAEKACAEVLSLPMFPELTRDQQKRVVEVVMEFVGIAAASAAHA
jgi:dTDP-4-amino-4,6-dideoxygalactose transaminase